MYHKVVQQIKPLGFTWETRDPFLFCVHHNDQFPAGNSQLGPAASLSGRYLGHDFTPKDGWRMYHGETIPGFPAHPHRGFETVTVVLTGFVDHSDSHGAAGRYGQGDVQWMTAGSGLQHAEMFPLLDASKPNPLELFQIWLNLPQKNKMVAPHYNMLWNEAIPVISETDAREKKTTLRIISGTLKSTAVPAPVPDSWASDPKNEVGIWIIKMDPEAQWTLPAASPEVNRTLYFYQGTEINVAGITVPSYHSVELMAEQDLSIINGADDGYLLLLQGKPINEPVVQHGPFVMNHMDEIHQAFTDFRRTQFGGWPWSRTDQVHPANSGRFAKYTDGREEKP
jgi:redox-sensitive bicupin YhaK (pirin superfamily)